MSSISKLEKLKILLNIPATDTSEDAKLQTYLNYAETEIINYLYGSIGLDGFDEIPSMPSIYDNIQIQACIVGYNLQGGEGETAHNENGINRTFKYADMLEYIHNHIAPFVKLV